MATDAEQDRLAAPHRHIEVTSEKERFTLELFDLLWKRYRDRVSYVQTYEEVVSNLGATFVNDHIAFRTWVCQRPTTGIVTLGRIFEVLGYHAAGCYQFPDKHLSAIHYQHPHPEFPKIFVSELRVWELSKKSRSIIQNAVKHHRKTLKDETLCGLHDLEDQTPEAREQLLRKVTGVFHKLPWRLPRKRDIVALNEESQYAAWVLAHGYNVNHFTALVNSHGVEPLDNIDKTVDALQQAGVPMKAEVEGEPGSKLRQTATEAVTIDVPVRNGRKKSKTEWTYAYFELAERGTVHEPDRGDVRFEGFLGPQATQLFEMTRVKE